MPPELLLVTAALLGFFALLGGIYAVLYSVGVLRRCEPLVSAALAVYVLHAVCAIALVGWTPLYALWKGLIVTSCVAYLVVPRITWRYLGRLHGEPDAPR